LQAPDDGGERALSPEVLDPHRLELGLAAALGDLPEGRLPELCELGAHPGLPAQVAAAAGAPACARARPTISPNACGSSTASAATILRSIATPAAVSPFTSWLYDSPLARAAALMRTIQSERKSRLRALRSR